MASSQQLTIVDNDTQQPVELVTIASNNPNVAVMTNEAGEVNISPLKGAARIQIRHVSYEPINTSYEKLSGKTIVYITPLKLAIDEVVISASKWEQSVYDIPNKITAISTKEVHRENPQTAADMLSSTGEVFVQKSQFGGGSPKLRGFSANSVLLVVDGVRMNNAIYRSGNLQNVINIDPNALEGAEVVFGPGSVIYGSDALGGVMDFHTKDLHYGMDSLRISGSAMGRYSSAANENTVHADLHMGGNALASYTSVSHSDFGDLLAGSNRPDGYPQFGKRPFYVAQNPSGEDIIIPNDDPNVQIGSGFSMTNLVQKVGWKASDATTLTYGFYYSTTSDIPRYDRLVETDDDGRPVDATWYYGPQTWMMHNLQYKTAQSTALFDQIKITAAWQDYEESRNDRGFGDDRLRTRTEMVDVYSLNIDVDKQLPSGNLYYGVEWLYNDVTSQGYRLYRSIDSIAPTTPRYPDGGSSYTSYAVYANYKWDISQSWTFNSGIRYSHTGLQARIEDQSDLAFPYDELNVTNGALNGSLGVVYNPSPVLKFSTALASGFRAPNIDDIGKVFDFSGGELQVPNPALEPEYSYNAEMGIESRLDTWEFGITAFYTWVDNAIVRRDFRFNGQDSIVYDNELRKVVALTNTGEAVIYGFSAELEYFFNERWQAASTFTWMDGEDITNNEPLRHTTPAFGKIAVNYQSERLWASCYGEFNAARLRADIPASEIDDKPYLYAMHESNPARDGSPAWYTLNFKVAWDMTDQINISGGIENLLDKHFRPYSSGISAPGRNITLALRATFNK